MRRGRTIGRGGARGSSPSDIAAVGWGCLGLLVLLALLGKCVGAFPDTGVPSVNVANSAPAEALLSARYIIVTRANCRAASRPAAALVVTLNRGDRVALRSEQGRWARVEPVGGTPCWMMRRFLSETMPVAPLPQGLRDSQPAPYGGMSEAGSGFYGTAPETRSRRSSWSRPRRSGGSSAGGCPCSSGRVCIGPRGGRYCITSGGNKRYGV
jgi:hypothetical protein